jgi:hypothetical protein
MNITDPSSLSYFLQDDLYLLQQDREAYTGQPIMDKATIEMVAEPVVETPGPVFNYTGGNQKNFLIVVNYPEYELMDEAHLTALTNSLKLKGLSIEDVAIFNVFKHTDTNYTTLQQYFNPLRILFLGDTAIPAGTKALTLNQITNDAECQLLYSLSFNEMMGNKDKTRAFWEQMKTL